MKKYIIPTTEIILQSAECCVTFGVEVASNPVVGGIESSDSNVPVIK